MRESSLALIEKGESKMDKEEKTLFKACYLLTVSNMWTIREVINMLRDVIPKDKSWAYLRKWKEIGFYSYSSSIDLGWINSHSIPSEYQDLMNDI